MTQTPFKKRQIKRTSDGSNTIYLPDLDEHYHSIHGAIQESLHVFIKHGLQKIEITPVNILEIGFGTGLNALLTAIEAERLKLNINYTGIEAYPVLPEQALAMQYCEHIDCKKCSSIYQALHSCEWEKPTDISQYFSLTKGQILFQDIYFNNEFDLIYFDAFGARVQPELWTKTIFESMYKTLKNNGILVTYSAKGSVRRAMQSVGFTVERLQGPPGKREMLRGVKR